MRPKWFFGGLFILNCFVYVTVALVSLRIAVGLDPIFANPVVYGFAYTIEAVILYVPFFILFRFAFRYLMRRAKDPRPKVVAGWLFAVLNLVTVGMSLYYSDWQFSLLPILVSIALNVANVGLFLICRQRVKEASGA